MLTQNPNERPRPDDQPREADDAIDVWGLAEQGLPHVPCSSKQKGSLSGVRRLEVGGQDDRAALR